MKLSYSTMRNVKSHISSSNLKKLNPISQESTDLNCKCDEVPMQCPVSGECTSGNVVYQAKVNSKFAVKSYIGMTARPFIERWKEHRGNIRHKHQQGTKLSNFVNGSSKIENSASYMYYHSSLQY